MARARARLGEPPARRRAGELRRLRRLLAAAAAAPRPDDRGSDRGLQLAAGAARGRHRGARRAAADRRPADRRVPRSRVRGVAQEGFRSMRALLAAALLALATTSALGAPKDRGPQWASLNADQQQALAPLQH